MSECGKMAVLMHCTRTPARLSSPIPTRSGAIMPGSEQLMQTSGLQLWFGGWKVTGSGADPARLCQIMLAVMPDYDRLWGGL